MHVKSFRFWILVFFSDGCYFFCFIKQLSWLDSNCKHSLRQQCQYQFIFSPSSLAACVFPVYMWFRAQTEMWTDRILVPSFCLFPFNILPSLSLSIIVSLVPRPEKMSVVFFLPLSPSLSSLLCILCEVY